MKSDAAQIRSWNSGDFELLAASAAHFSARTLSLRFWGGAPHLPASYLRATRKHWPSHWDAVVAVVDGEIVGWAEYGRNLDRTDTADVAVCVADSEQGHGIGTALLAAIVAKAQSDGLASVHADIAPYNHPARHAWHTVTGGVAATFALAS
jgi:GNAT superfamily N-acetyltransferase